MSAYNFKIESSTTPAAAPQGSPPSFPAEAVDLLRQLVEVQREQLNHLRASAAAHDNGARWRAFLNRWHEEFPDLSDTCRKALSAASANADRLGAQLHLVHGDLLEGLPRDLDLIVANLPYLAPGTAGYEEEPPTAVFSTGDGLDHYRRLLAGAADHLGEGGGVILQFDGRVLEAERSELPLLRNRLESLVAAAA